MHALADVFLADIFPKCWWPLSSKHIPTTSDGESECYLNDLNDSLKHPKPKEGNM